jgi:uncharacterized iron-regulated membrane protein
VLKPAVIARTLHKWLALLVGLQVLIWLVSGLYMVVINIDFIHGDPLVRNMQQKVVVSSAPSITIAEIMKRYPDAMQISLRPVMDRTYYFVTTANGRYLVDIESGSLASPLGEDSARQIAAYHYAGEEPLRRARLISADPPAEIQTRPLPLWRIDFDDRFSTSFYIDPYSGSLVTRRHQYWRIFDFMWMLHIMDYENRVDAHNRLLLTTQVSALTFAVSGLWLLFYSFSAKRRRKEKTAR